MTEDSIPAADQATEKKQPESDNAPGLNGKSKPSEKPTGAASSILRTLKIILALGLIVALLAASWMGWTLWQTWALEADKSDRQLSGMQDAIDSIQQQARLDQ